MERIPTLRRLCDCIVRRDDGQDLIEYALLVGMIALVAVSAVGSVGQVINDVFWTAISAGLNELP